MKNLAALLFILIASSVFGAGPESQYANQCSEKDRSDYISRADFKATWRKCGIDATGRASGTVKCLKKHYPDLSQGCTQCFGDYVGCARANCLNRCWSNPEGADCEACGNQYCLTGLISCSGVPAEELPRALFF